MAQAAGRKTIMRWVGLVAIGLATSANAATCDVNDRSADAGRVEIRSGVTIPGDQAPALPQVAWWPTGSNSAVSMALVYHSEPVNSPLHDPSGVQLSIELAAPLSSGLQIVQLELEGDQVIRFDGPFVTEPLKNGHVAIEVGFGATEKPALLRALQKNTRATLALVAKGWTVAEGNFNLADSPARAGLIAKAWSEFQANDSRFCR